MLLLQFTKHYKRNDLQTTVCLHELVQLRTVGASWHTFLKLVRTAWEQCMAAEGTFGEVEVMLVVARKQTRGNVVGLHAEQVQVPNEMLTWPK